jgi:tetratricopeptide (TPR) repeat protein
MEFNKNKIMLIFCIALIFNARTVFGADKWLDLCHEADDLVKKGQFQEAYVVQKNAVKESKSFFFNGRNTKLAYALYQLGDICMTLKNYDEAETSYSKSSDIYLSALGDSCDYLATAYRGLGNVYHETSRLVQSEEYLNKAISIYVKNHDTCYEDAIGARSVLGQVYLEEKKYELAKNGYLESLNCFNKENVSFENQAYIYSQLGLIIYYEQNDYKSSEDYLKRALDLDKSDSSTENVQHQVGHLSILAPVYFVDKKFKMSEEIDRKLLQLTSSHPESYYLERSRAYLSFAQNEMFLKNKVKSEKYLKQALDEYSRIVSATVEDRKGFLDICSTVYGWFGDKDKQQFVQGMLDKLN